jgi:hypothetical protein
MKFVIQTCAFVYVGLDVSLWMCDVVRVPCLCTAWKAALGVHTTLIRNMPRSDKSCNSDIPLNQHVAIHSYLPRRYHSCWVVVAF